MACQPLPLGHYRQEASTCVYKLLRYVSAMRTEATPGLGQAGLGDQVAEPSQGAG